MTTKPNKVRAALTLILLSGACHAATFAEAIDSTLAGIWMQRPSWAENQFLMFRKGEGISVRRPPLLGPFQAGTHIVDRSRFDVCTREGPTHYTCSPYTFNTADTLTNDWEPFQA